MVLRGNLIARGKIVHACVGIVRVRSSKIQYDWKTRDFYVNYWKNDSKRKYFERIEIILRIRVARIIVLPLSHYLGIYKYWKYLLIFTRSSN